MSTKIIVAIIVVLVVIAIGGWVFINANRTTPANPAPAPSPATTTAQTQTQVQGQDVKVGSGDEAKPGTFVSVLYTGKFTDGTVFDSSAAHNNQPLRFQLGSTGIIPGFQIGVNGMKVGGDRLLAIPPALGYGAQDVKDATGKVIIPANSTLIFDIQLLKVEQASSTPPVATTSPKAK